MRQVSGGQLVERPLQVRVGDGCKLLRRECVRQHVARRPPLLLATRARPIPWSNERTHPEPRTTCERWHTTHATVTPRHLGGTSHVPVDCREGVACGGLVQGLPDPGRVVRLANRAHGGHGLLADTVSSVPSHLAWCSSLPSLPVSGPARARLRPELRLRPHRHLLWPAPSTARDSGSGARCPGCRQTLQRRGDYRGVWHVALCPAFLHRLHRRGAVLAWRRGHVLALCLVCDTQCTGVLASALCKWPAGLGLDMCRRCALTGCTHDIGAA